MGRCCIACLVLAACLAPVWGAPAQEDDLQARIDRAAELNVTAPWQESQKLLEELASELDEATPRQRARVTFLLARNQAIAGHYERAIDMLEPLRSGSTDPDLKLSAYRLSANAALNRDWFEEGYRYLRAGLELLPEVRAEAPKVKLLGMAAYFYGSVDEGDKGIDYAEQELTIAESSGDARLQCIAWRDMSLAQRRAGDLGPALENGRRGLEHCNASGDPVLTGTITVLLGALMVDHGNIEEGLRTIRRGLGLVEESGYRDGVLNAKLSLGRALVEAGQLDQAKDVLEPLVSEFEAVDFWRNLSDSHRLLAEIAEARGNYKEALRHQKVAESASDSLLDRERAMRLAYLQVEFDLRRKEQQIALLREQNRVLELESEAQRQRRYLAFGSVAALSIIGILLVLLVLRTRSDRHHLLWLSQHDGLTGLRNHGSFFRRANEALAVTKKSGALFTLIVADIDYFKAINDEHGHVVGDAVLSQTGELLREVFEPQGIIGRIGGEEFAIALPGMDRDRATDLIHELNDRLQPTRENGSVVEITLSYGLAEASDTSTVEKLRLYADRALYEAKRRGRDQIVDAAEVVDDPSIQPKRRADDTD